LLGTSPQPTSDIGIYPGLPGPPGRGGAGGAAAPVQGACKGPDGQSAVGGLAATTYSFDGKPLNNFLAPGDQMFSGRFADVPRRHGRIRSAERRQPVPVQVGRLSMVFEGRELRHGSGSHDADRWQLLRRQRPGPTCSNTYGRPGVYLVVQNNGYVVLYDGVVPIWQVPKE
jgi:hypothetical protein